MELYVKDSIITSKVLKFSNDVEEMLVTKTENFILVIALISKPPDARLQLMNVSILVTALLY